MRTLRNTPGFMVNFPSVLNDVFGNDINNLHSGTKATPVNILENDNEYGIELIAPGFKKDDFNIKIEDNKLEISAEVAETKKDENAHYTLREFEKLSFKRTFTLPDNKINEDEIKANYNDGILMVSLPKREEAKPKAPKQIAIK